MHSPPKVSKHSAILLFLKAPRLGYVKTRLARSIGDASALHVYRALVERQLKQIPSHYSVEIHFAPEDALFEMRQWLGAAYTYYPQCAGGLGLRLENAVAKAFERGARSVSCIGGDCPHLNQAHFEQTETALRGDYEVVFGPSDDGGYYLIGLSAPHTQLFHNIPWSTQDTLDESLKQATTLKLRVKLLDNLYDVDEIEELNKAIDEGFLFNFTLVNSIGNQS